VITIIVIVAVVVLIGAPALVAWLLWHDSTYEYPDYWET
jgi:hypothetical protein